MAALRRKLEAAEQELQRLRRSLVEQARQLDADRAALATQRRILRELEASVNGPPQDPAADGAAQASAVDRPGPAVDAHAIDAQPVDAHPVDAQSVHTQRDDAGLGLKLWAMPRAFADADALFEAFDPDAHHALHDVDQADPPVRLPRVALSAAALAERSGRGARELLAQNQPADALQAPANEAPAEPAPATPTVGQAPDQPQQARPPEVAPIFDQPGVLTPKGRYVLEPGLEYAYSSSNRVSVIGFEIFPALLIGVLDIRSANRSSYIASLTGRYGISNRMEAEIKLPYVYRTETLQTREFLQASFADARFDSSGSGLGDIELALRYQFNQGGMEKPYYIGTLRLKTRTGRDQFEVPIDDDVPRNTGGRFREQPTGTGFYGIRPELTVIYPTDPLVFFGSLNYLWNIGRNNVTDRLGRTNDIDPGDAIGFNFGMGLALNERASFSIGYEHTIYGKTKVNGITPDTELVTQLGSLLVGYSYRLSSKRSINLALGIGATRDAPDVQINLRVPTNF